MNFFPRGVTMKPKTIYTGRFELEAVNVEAGASHTITIESDVQWRAHTVGVSSESAPWFDIEHIRVDSLEQMAVRPAPSEIFTPVQDAEISSLDAMTGLRFVMVVHNRSEEKHTFYGWVDGNSFDRLPTNAIDVDDRCFRVHPMDDFRGIRASVKAGFMVKIR